MFDDLFESENSLEPVRKKCKDGCWNCGNMTTAYFSLWCNEFKKYKLISSGVDCEKYKARP